MGMIFRDMTAEEQAYYDEDSKKFPWLKTITMSDDEFLACYERDLGKGICHQKEENHWISSTRDFFMSSSMTRYRAKATLPLA